MRRAVRPAGGGSCTSSGSRSPRGNTEASRARRGTRRPSACGLRRPGSDRHRTHRLGPGGDHPLPAGLVARAPGAARHGARSGAGSSAHCWPSHGTIPARTARRPASRGRRTSPMPSAPRPEPAAPRGAAPAARDQRRRGGQRARDRCSATGRGAGPRAGGGGGAARTGAGGIPPAVDAGAACGRAISRAPAGAAPARRGCRGSTVALGPNDARAIERLAERGEAAQWTRRWAAGDGRVRDRPLRPGPGDGPPPAPAALAIPGRCRFGEWEVVSEARSAGRSR